MNKCPKCLGEAIMGVEYAYGSPERYDGVSEWRCMTCHARFGRWSLEELRDGQLEPRFGRLVEGSLEWKKRMRA